jgi:hypothetical protein
MGAANCQTFDVDCTDFMAKSINVRLSYENFKMQESYSQHFIFFATYEWAQHASICIPVKPFQLRWGVP